MRERLTARVLLLDPQDRILLMKGRLPHDPTAPPVWFTVGGGAEPGESVLETAAREIVEETGFLDAQLGPVVWYSEAQLFDRKGRPVHFKEHFVVARTVGGALSRQGWQPLEHEFVDELRWWTLAELQATDEIVYPEGLAGLLPDVLAGRIAAEPLVIRTLDGPVLPMPRAPDLSLGG
jgi:8-oxo-dGTP pyrophosphatase MutT (NUDIX family)